MILHENRLPADDSQEISCLIRYFSKSGKSFNCRLLQIIGGVLSVNYILCSCTMSKALRKNGFDHGFHSDLIMTSMYFNN